MGHEEACRVHSCLISHQPHKEHVFSDFNSFQLYVNVQRRHISEADSEVSFKFSKTVFLVHMRL